PATISRSSHRGVCGPASARAEDPGVEVEVRASGTDARQAAALRAQAPQRGVRHSHAPLVPNGAPSLAARYGARGCGAGPVRKRSSPGHHRRSPRTERQLRVPSLGTANLVPLDETMGNSSSAVILVAALVYLAACLSPPSLMDDVDAVQAQIARN